jgi:hypothetical protein
LFGAKILLAGRSAESILIQAVAQTHPDLKMRGTASSKARV